MQNNIKLQGLQSTSEKHQLVKKDFELQIDKAE
jgi:hypothetical protein